LTKTHLIETADEIQAEWLKGHQHIGITGGASTLRRPSPEVQTRLEKLTKKELILASTLTYLLFRRKSESRRFINSI